MEAEIVNSQLEVAENRCGEDWEDLGTKEDEAEDARLKSAEERARPPATMFWKEGMYIVVML